MIEDLAFPDSAGVTVPERLVLRGGRWQAIRLAVRYARFRHARAGICLIDTGYSARVTGGARSLPLTLYAAILRPALTAQALPAAEPEAGTILLTHLHADHVSALRDYPQAALYADAEGAAHFLEGGPAHRLRHGVFRELLPADLSSRLVPLTDCPDVTAPFGLGPARDVFHDGEVLAVPLPGHIRGHTGYLFARQDPPILYAGDADWLWAAIREGRSPGAPARWILDDPRAAGETARRLAVFDRAGGRVVLCHDPEPPA
jgi:glyoxylase-like metal-dependent hydrolase (beta-lactamase superfamily II)